MGRKSRIDRIPEDARRSLQAWLADPAISQQEAAESLSDLLDEMGWDGPRPSPSAVNRYAQKMNEVGRRLQERHQVAEMWTSRFGRVPQGQMGQLIMQIIHGLAFDVGVQLSEEGVEGDDMPGVVRMLRDLSVMLERTERAASLNADREQAIKRRAADEALAEAAQRVDTAATARGLSADDARFWREQVLMGM
jgi:hypothetical protein